MAPNSLGEIIKKIRVPVVAEACGCSPRAIYKWIANGSLPRTDYTDETNYAEKSLSLLAASLLLLRSGKSASLKPPNQRPFQTTPEEVSQMESSTTRNKVEARRIESWLHSQIAELGTTNIAKVAGVNKSTVSRWRESLLPNMSLLLAILISNRPGEKGDFEA
jgi:hypothetical protein